MEINYTPVTHADRMASLLNKPTLIKENNSTLTWKLILGLAALGVITTILVNYYYEKKKDNLNNNLMV